MQTMRLKAFLFWLILEVEWGSITFRTIIFRIIEIYYRFKKKKKMIYAMICVLRKIEIRGYHVE